MKAAREPGGCPICGQLAERDKVGKLWPFCSERCWAIDLGKWLGEEYRMADPSAEAVSLPGRDDE